MKLYLSLLFLFASLLANAQQSVINGIVIDDLTQEPLPFTNIGVFGKDVGSISNSEGYYTLSLGNMDPNDTVFFSFVGYKQLKKSVAQLQDESTVRLSESAVQLSSYSVLSREYTPHEILDFVVENFEKNHTTTYQRQQMFTRDASYSTIHQSDMTFKESTFKAIDQVFVDGFNDKMPEKMNVYNDYLVDMLYGDAEQKVIPIEGQSLTENWNFDEEFNKRIRMLASDVETDLRDPENYFKVRSGIFAGKLDFGSDSSFVMSDDSLDYIMSPSMVHDDINYLTETYASIHSKRWDFFQNYRWYNYELKDVAIVNDELAYIIEFSPARSKGKYTGTICVATDSYALLQVDYAFADGKTGTGVSLLGLDYSVEDRSGRAIFEKRNGSHYLKYLARESVERYGVGRTLTIKQKQKSSFFDKTLQEVKIHLDMDVTFEQKIELLVVSQDAITPQEYKAAVQPAIMRVKKVDKYSSDIWNNSSIIEPTKALKDYQQQF